MSNEEHTCPGCGKTLLLLSLTRRRCPQCGREVMKWDIRQVGAKLRTEGRLNLQVIAAALLGIALIVASFLFFSYYGTH
jgi:hypothetical protein